MTSQFVDGKVKRGTGASLAGCLVATGHAFGLKGSLPLLSHFQAVWGSYLLHGSILLSLPRRSAALQNPGRVGVYRRCP
jgi:hypothetical protein